MPTNCGSRVSLGRDAGYDPAQLAAGLAGMRDALGEFAASGRLTIEMRGPLHNVCCAAAVEPLAKLQWNGFREGWHEREGDPTGERSHAVHDQYEGEFQLVWRAAFQAGAAAAANYRNTGSN